MSDMVERLAEKWDEWVSTNPGSPPEECPYVDARWWLNAIADELDTPGDNHPDGETTLTSCRQMCADHLRTQAQGTE